MSDVFIPIKKNKLGQRFGFVFKLGSKVDASKKARWVKKEINGGVNVNDGVGWSGLKFYVAKEVTEKMKGCYVGQVSSPELVDVLKERLGLGGQVYSFKAVSNGGVNVSHEKSELVPLCNGHDARSEEVESWKYIIFQQMCHLEDGKLPCDASCIHNVDRSEVAPQYESFGAQQGDALGKGEEVLVQVLMGSVGELH
ncbi:hypothetical protein VNO78_07359 [Psophocarpus tetragonolobus]|uniref:Uncharacterized protein n=1 Tax=Psophocarpus tetragonolobus TaxID=3891 RepID=A0AAN9SW20_PSOTE